MWISRQLGRGSPSSTWRTLRRDGIIKWRPGEWGAFPSVTGNGFGCHTGVMSLSADRPLFFVNGSNSEETFGEQAVRFSLDPVAILSKLPSPDLWQLVTRGPWVWQNRLTLRYTALRLSRSPADIPNQCFVRRSNFVVSNHYGCVNVYRYTRTSSW